MKLLLLSVCLVYGASFGDPRTTSPQGLSFLHSEKLNQGKPRTLFARRGVMEYHKLRTMKANVDTVSAAPHCSGVSESCFPHSRCCNPCASCHCRFFNTVCYCWRLGHHCQKTT